MGQRHIPSAFGSGSVFSYIDPKTVIGFNEHNELRIYQELKGQEMVCVNLGKVSKQEIDGLTSLLSRLKIHAQP